VELHTDLYVVDAAGTPLDLGAATWCLELHELPAHPGQATKARRQLDEIGLVTLASDSLGWAAAQAGIDLAGANPAARVQLRSDDRAGRATRAVLRQLGDVVAASWHGAADGVDPESLHELRVALRRARAVLKASRDVLPEHAREEALDLVVSLARHTGTPRDLDVHLLEWTSYVAPLDPSDRALLEPVRELLATRRDTAHVSLQEAMHAAGRHRWHRRFDELIDTRRDLDGERPSDARHPVGRVVAKRIEREDRRLVAHGRRITATSPSDAVHRLRKDAKQLRYLLDAFGSLASSSHRDAYLAELKTLQDRLGALQDATVHRIELDDVAAELRTAPQATFDALAAMADVLDDHCLALRSELVEALDVFDGKATRRAIRRVIDDLRD
jgi:CHAD domain-containing protein